MPRVTFALTANGEIAVIERCLSSVEHLVDSVCVSLNGDDDGSQAFIEDWCRQKGKDCLVWWMDWKDYDVNKTANLDKVRSTFNPDYIIFLDADEVLLTNPGDVLSYPGPADAAKLWEFFDARPHIDLLNLNTHHREKIYPRWQILRNNQRWVWYLPFQETLEGETSNQSDFYPGLINLARKEGYNSRHPEALKINLQKLERWAQQNVGHKYYYRALYYLGQDYFWMEPETSLRYHRQCFHCPGLHTQERYLSAVAIAKLNNPRKNRLPQGVSTKERKKFLLKAIEVDPRRLEAYYRLMMDALRANKFRQGAAWAVAAPNNRHVHPHFLFAELQLYRWKFDFQITWGAYQAAYSGAYRDNGLLRFALEAGERCLTGIPSYKVATLKQLQFNMDTARSELAAIEGGPGRTLAASSSATSSSASSPASYRGSDTPTVMVIDNFYSDPRRIREIALEMEFNVTGNYPGGRTQPFYPEGIKERLESIVKGTITYWPTDKYNGSFQLTTAEHVSWIHRDKTDWSVVVFLTPEAPVDGGTVLYRHLETGLSSVGNNPELEARLLLDKAKPEAWEATTRVGNLFNRAVFFRGRESHMSDKYFGSGLLDGRLFQTFFFDARGW